VFTTLNKKISQAIIVWKKSVLQSYLTLMIHKKYIKRIERRDNNK